jgi:glyoxylase-like metal-dependent hydrolase (beta-lactamase superfamily II)
MKQDIDYLLADRIPEPGEAIELAPGILWLRMPMPMALNHINIYLLDDGDGWTVIDCGLADQTIMAIWERVGSDVLGGRPITRIIGTHFHPDHVGLAGWMLERHDASFWMSRAEWLNARAFYLDTSVEFIEQMAGFYTRTGMTVPEIERLRLHGNEYRRLVTPIPSAFSRIAPDTRFTIGGRDWLPIFGAGHSPEHVSLYSPELNLILGGDMLLPRITPIIAVWWTEPDGNPLADYLKFLDGLDDHGDDVRVLPAHDRPYRGLKSRVQYLGRHHEQRLDTTAGACRAPATAREVMGVLFDRELDAVQTRFAIGESLAHLHLLLDQGALNRHLADDGVYRYERAA